MESLVDERVFVALDPFQESAKGYVLALGKELGEREDSFFCNFLFYCFCVRLWLVDSVHGFTNLLPL